MFRDYKDFSTTKPEGVFRVGILGDSFVFGQGIKKEKDRFSNILEYLIRDNYRIKCEVYNMGRCGWNTLDERNYFLEKGVMYKFDALVLSCLEIDDFEAALSIFESLNNSFEKPTLYPLANESYVFGFFYAQYLKLRYQDFIKNKLIDKIEISILDKNNWRRYFSYIQDIKNVCENNGIEFYLVSFSPIGWSKDEEVGMIVEKFEELFKSYLDTYNIKYIFLDENFSKYNYKDLIVSAFDFHPNELANGIAARKLLTLMESQLDTVTAEPIR